MPTANATTPSGPESCTTETNNQHDTTRGGAPELGATVRPIENQAQAAAQTEGTPQARRNLLGAMDATDVMNAMDYSKLSEAELDSKLTEIQAAMAAYPQLAPLMQGTLRDLTTEKSRRVSFAVVGTATLPQ
eukprot:CAMPEP_0118842140 /NCGR_PEP_ID=MMETSP1162-20130426/78391_1 /TAXON_ID=33656 /ORGANISM="Phaeocystis Sp, Strain CCMP2710" /LENGTH=131 /DNA_ID=CAMNT_0006774199 /DNA_START=1 /DNA_END=393 /DNA_ORIENTATION=+